MFPVKLGLLGRGAVRRWAGDSDPEAGGIRRKPQGPSTRLP